MKNTLRKILYEAIKLDVEKGDVILTGRFKNKRRIVKTIGTDRFGQPTINGKSILKFKIEKHMPKNKQSAKTRKEMNEMNEKTLRRAIRSLLLESNERYYEKLAMLFNGGIGDIKQAMELADAIGLIRIIETSDDDFETLPLDNAGSKYHTFRFKCLEEDFGPYLKKHKDMHGPHKTSSENVYWSFRRRMSVIELMVVDTPNKQ